MMKIVLTIVSLVLLAVQSVRGEGLDSLTICLQAGDSCMQQYNTFEALKHYQKAYALSDTLITRTKLADCYYKRANYRQTAELLKNIPEDSLSHEAFRQLAFSYQKQGDNDSFVFWAQQLVARFPMDGEVVAGLTLGYTKASQPDKGIICGLKYTLKDSTNIMVNRALADAWFVSRNFTAAGMMYERLMEQGDSTFNTLYSAGMSYSQLEDLDRSYKYLLKAFLLSGMQHAGCAYRLGVVCVDQHSYDEGLGYLHLAEELMLPDTTVMKAVTLSEGEAYYLTKQYDKAVEAWKRHLTYNPGSVATYYNIASAYYYFLPDGQQAKTYLEKFLQVARQEEKPTQQLKDMMDKAAELLRTTNFGPSKKVKR